jgi:hypothetical protein
MLQLFLIIADVAFTGDKLIASIFKTNENPGQGKTLQYLMSATTTRAIIAYHWCC